MLVLEMTDPKEWNLDPGSPKTWKPAVASGGTITIPLNQIFAIKINPNTGKIRIRADRTYRVNAANQLVWIDVLVGPFV